MKKKNINKISVILFAVVVFMVSGETILSSGPVLANHKTEHVQLHRKKKKKKNKKKQTPIYKIGETFKVGDVEYTINSKETAQNIGGEFGENANGTYLILNVTVKNNGSKSITITDSFFKLLKGKAKYETDSAAGIFANEDGDFFYSDLNPENSVTGNVVFDLNPETVSDPNLQLQVQTGYWGTQKGLVSINS